MPASVQSPPTLRQFGKYILDEEIARGGMARVFLARLRGLGGFEKKLVVKQVLPELASDPRFVEMFVEEAKTLVQMSHPHIVPVYELGVVDGVYFLAMEFVDGATLAEVLSDGALPPTLAAHVGLHVSEALSYAHERFELVHRDVTPRNIIIDALGHVRLLDFGIAAKAEGSLEGEIFGSHGYMSPEQALGKSVDPNSDMFSLGAVLYEALTNLPAFLKRSADETRTALLEGVAPTLADHEGVPDALSRVVDDCLAKAPEDRPQTAKAVGRRLRAFLAAEAPEGVGPELGERAEAAIERRARRPSRRPASLDGPTNPEGVVQTIATSVTLRQILAGAETDPDDDDVLTAVPVVDETAVTGDHASDISKTGRIDDAQDRTLPIPGRTTSQEGTVPIPKEERARRAPIDSLASTDPREVRQAETDEEDEKGADARRFAMWIVVIGLGIAGIFGLRGLDAGTGTVPAAHGDETETGPGPRPADDHEGSSPIASGSAAETEAGAEAVADAGTVTVPDTGSSAVVTPLPARLSISAQPWGNYVLDGRDLGNRVIQGRRIPAGRHTLRISNDQLGKEATLSFDAPPGSNLRAIVDLRGSNPEIRITPR